ncbi:pesticin C-terminus-like muramidase [Ottowia sp. oral taxon 894]|uniref:pesticin C-terminus-like muramidase n=1 Tax=Ottowia sp. oral taxon 894 TaxID=1658672 RepID=UPI00068000E4|nr:pesticin C-terminus-like muramidase [Ottowia sp. oral taxon 894]
MPQPPASGGSSLTEMALNPCGQHSASPHAAGQAAGADLTPAQQQACKHNENLRQQLNPQDWSQVLYQIGKNTKKLEGATFSKGIVTLKGDKEALAGAAYDKALKEKPEETPKNYLRLSTHKVGPNPNSQSTMSDEMAQKINKKHGASINFEQISNYEGGQALRGYVPWWPIIKSISKNGAITVLLNFQEDKKGNFITKEDGTKILNGSSQSGVTIGTGVDLGQQKPVAYKERLKAFGVSQELIDKLEPYMHLKRAEAGEYLLAHPLTVTKEEADLLDAEMKDDHLKNTIAEYGDIVKDIKKHRTFKELSSAEQTILFSRHYQDGNIKKGASREIAEFLAQGLVQNALDKLNTKHYRDDSHKNRIPLEHADLQAWFNTINAEEYKVKQDDEKATPASADQTPAQPQTPTPSAHPGRRHRK